MIRITELIEHAHQYDDLLVLPFDKRQKSRLRATLESGAEVGLTLPRGTVLRGGDYLRSEDGRFIKVQSAPESTSKITSNDPLLLMRVAYHLGNRHVPLEVHSDGLRYLHDHVLDDMVKQLGLTVKHEWAPFEPERGAYGGGHHHHH